MSFAHYFQDICILISKSIPWDLIRARFCIQPSRNGKRCLPVGGKTRPGGLDLTLPNDPGLVPKRSWAYELDSTPRMMHLCQVLESQTGDFTTGGNKLFTRLKCKTLVKCIITNSHEGKCSSRSTPETGDTKQCAISNVYLTSVIQHRLIG